jgi:hypothetical protein
MRCRTLKIRGERFTISSTSELSGWRFLNGSRLSAAWPDSSLPGSSAYFNRVRGEFTRASGHSPYSSKLSWERASLEDCGLALANLYKNTDIFKRTTEFTPVVNRIVNEIARTTPTIVHLLALTLRSGTLLPRRDSEVYFASAAHP